MLEPSSREHAIIRIMTSTIEMRIEEISHQSSVRKSLANFKFNLILTRKMLPGSLNNSFRINSRIFFIDHMQEL